MAVSTVTIAGGQLIVTGDGGNNDVAVGIDPSNAADYRLSDSTGIADPIPTGCVRVSPTAIRCPVAGITTVQTDLGAGDDLFKVSSGSVPEGVTVNVFGGDGNDTIRGRNGPGLDQLLGDGGDDTIYGEGGDDTLDGGDGNDTLLGGPGNDLIFGRAGNDDMFGGGGRDKMAGGTGHDTIEGLGGDDALKGEQGNDKLSGGSGNDKGSGGAGNDTFIGGGGTDKGSAEKEKSVEK